MEQTWENLELIISDNGSTDETEAICARFVAQDPRVRYYRQPENLGASPNFNKTFELARGPFFKWAADDDTIEPTYLEKCLQPLLDDERVVLSHSETLVDDGRRRVALRELSGLEAPASDSRFSSIVLSAHWTQDIFGLYRSATLRRTGLHRNYYGSDKVLLAEMALLGHVVRIHEPLFVNRDHPGRSLRSCDLIERRRFIDTSTVDRMVIPNLSLFVDYCKIVNQHVSEPGERRRCYRALAKWWFVNWHLARFGLDVACATVPAFAPLLHELRARYHRQLLGAERRAEGEGPQPMRGRPAARGGWKGRLQSVSRGSFR